MQIAKIGDRVRVNYIGTVDDGTIFDQSPAGEAREFTIGSGQFVHGFESAVVGMTPGQSRITRIPAAEAYGLRKTELIAPVDRSNIPRRLKLDVGSRLKARTADGEEISVTVSELTKSTVMLDANHPLAGKDLTFEIELLEITKAA